VAKACDFTVSGLVDSWEVRIAGDMAGSPVMLADVRTPIAGVTIKALKGNVGMVYVGGFERQYFELDKQELVTIWTDDLSNVYIRGANVGDGVCYLIIEA
jgi:outer membrane protein assembly factor BamB